MPLNRRYLNLTEKLIEFVLEPSEEVEFALDSLRTFLEEDVDGYTSLDGESLAYAVQSRLEEIWSLLVDTDRSRSAALIAFFKRFIRKLERDSGYEADIDFPNPRSIDDGSIEAEIEAEDACEEEE